MLLMALVDTSKLANSARPYAPIIETIAKINHSIRVEKSIRDMDFHLDFVKCNYMVTDIADFGSRVVKTRVAPTKF